MHGRGGIRQHSISSGALSITCAVAERQPHPPTWPPCALASVASGPAFDGRAAAAPPPPPPAPGRCLAFGCRLPRVYSAPGSMVGGRRRAWLAGAASAELLQRAQAVRRAAAAFLRSARVSGIRAERLQALQATRQHRSLLAPCPLWAVGGSPLFPPACPGPATAQLCPGGLMVSHVVRAMAQQGRRAKGRAKRAVVCSTGACAGAMGEGHASRHLWGLAKARGHILLSQNGLALVVVGRTLAAHTCTVGGW